MLHTMAGAQPFEPAEMIDIDLTGVTRHRLGKAPCPGIAGAQHLIP